MQGRTAYDVVAGSGSVPGHVILEQLWELSDQAELSVKRNKVSASIFAANCVNKQGTRSPVGFS